MATSKFVIVGQVTIDGASVAAEMAPAVAGNFNTTGAGAWESIRDIADFIEAQVVCGGISVVYYDTAVSASTTGTFTGDPLANDTVTVNGVAFTAKSSGAVGNQYNFTVGNVTATAAALAAAINASTTAAIVGTVGASSSAGVVTFYSLVPGSVGLNIPISEATSNFTVAASTFSTGGTQAHSTIFEAGVATSAS